MQLYFTIKITYISPNLQGKKESRKIIGRVDHANQESHVLLASTPVLKISLASKINLCTNTGV